MDVDEYRRHLDFKCQQWRNSRQSRWHLVVNGKPDLLGYSKQVFCWTLGVTVPRDKQAIPFQEAYKINCTYCQRKIAAHTRDCFFNNSLMPIREWSDDLMKPEPLLVLCDALEEEGRHKDIRIVRVHLSIIL